MPSSYTPSLRLTLPVTGELSGTWGNTVNTGITNLVDSSVAGTAAVTMTDAEYTLTTANGATDEARKMFVTLTGTLTAARNVICPAASKLYFIKNTTTGGFAVTLKTSAGTGISVPNGKSMVLYCNGTDVLDATNHYSSLTLANALPVLSGGTGVTTSTGTGSVVLNTSPTLVTPALGTPSSGVLTNATGLPLTTGVTGTLAAANGGTGQSSYTTGDLIYASGATALSKLGVGTAGQVLTSTGSAPQWSTLSGVAVTTFSAGTTGFTPSSATSGAVTLAGTLATTNGGTGLTSFTANGVVYASSTSALTTGSALTFDGTSLGIGAAPTGFGKLDVSQGTNFRILFSGNASYGNNAIAGINDAGAETHLGLAGTPIAFYVQAAEQMRLTSTGLGIGTSSPGAKLDVAGVAANTIAGVRDTTGHALFRSANDGNTAFFGVDSSAGLVTGSANSTFIWNYTNVPLLFGVNSAERMRLDSSGNLGLGVTPSAWGSDRKILQIGGATYTYFAGNGIANIVSNNTYVDSGGTSRYLQSYAAGIYQQNGNGDHYWYTAPSGTAGNAISFTQAMTLDASGNLFVGTTTASYATSGRGLIELNGSSNALIAVKTSDTARGYFAASTSITELAAVGASQPLVFTTNSSERMRLDSSGNLGLGVTPSNAYTPGKVIQIVSGGVVLYGSSTTTSLGNNYNIDVSGNATYQLTQASSRYQQDTGAHIWFNAPSGTAGNAISFTQAMTLNSDGHLLVGATSNPGVLNKSVVVNSGASSLAGLVMQNNATGTGSTDGSHITINGTDLLIVNAEAAPIIFRTNNTEAARITSGGALVVGNTAAAGFEFICASNNSSVTAPFSSWNRATTGDNYFAGWYTEGTATLRGTVDYDRAGGLVRYNTTSDYRAKDIIGPVQDPGATIDALKVYEGQMKGATQSRPMLIAHEAQAVTPYAVSGEKDAVNEDGSPKLQQMDVSALVPLLLAEIQSLRARVAQLESK